MTGYTTGVGNELLASPGATYAYDAEGNMTAKTETATGNTWAYSYDIRNRMTGVTQKNSGGTVIYQASYTYDALDRRIATTVNGTTTWTVYDGQNTYADFSGAGVLKTRYLYGPAVDALLARTDASGTTAWYLTDRLGSVRDLASTSGTALDHLAYDAYGNIVSESQPSNGDRFKWTAREWDGTTGLQFNRHRYYAPGVGRWTQLDPIGIQHIDYNLYQYVGNGPEFSGDPDGESWTPDRWDWHHIVPQSFYYNYLKQHGIRRALIDSAENGAMIQGAFHQGWSEAAVRGIHNTEFNLKIKTYYLEALSSGVAINDEWVRSTITRIKAEYQNWYGPNGVAVPAEEGFRRWKTMDRTAKAARRAKLAENCVFNQIQNGMRIVGENSNVDNLISYLKPAGVRVRYQAVKKTLSLVPGLGQALAVVGLVSAVPVVGTVKVGFEIVRGRDFIPDQVV